MADSCVGTEGVSDDLSQGFSSQGVGTKAQPDCVARCITSQSEGVSATGQTTTSTKVVITHPIRDAILGFLNDAFNFVTKYPAGPPIQSMPFSQNSQNPTQPSQATQGPQNSGSI